MSISRADRASDTNRITDMREDYEERQVQTEKRKNAELKRNQKKHQDELKQIKENYESKIGNMQDKFGERLTEQEQRHQKQISDVRSLYLNQLKNKMEEAHSERSELSENFEAEKESQKKISESQKELMKRKFSAEIVKRDQSINELHEKNRQDLQESVSERSRRLQNSYDKELKTLSKNFEAEKENNYSEKSQLKSFYENQLSELERKRSKENNQWANRYSASITNLSQNHAEDAQEKSEVLKSEIKKNKEKFNLKLAELQEKLSGNNEEFRSTIDERYNNQVKAKDFEINRLKNKMYVDVANEKKRGELEKENIVVDYEKRQNILQGSVDQQREELKAINNQRIQKVIDQNSNFNSEVSRKHKMEQNLMNERHRQDRSAILENNKNEVYNLQNSTEKRIDAIQKVSNDKESKLIAYYSEYLDLLKEGYIDKVNEQREKNDKDLVQLNEIYSDKFRKLKSLYEQKLERNVNEYEGKISKLNDNHERELKSMKNLMENKLAEKDRETKLALNSSEHKYEGKIKTIQEQYENQLDKTNDRHHEELKKMAVKMQNYSRKA